MEAGVCRENEGRRSGGAQVPEAECCVHELRGWTGDVTWVGSSKI